MIYSPVWGLREWLVYVWIGCNDLFKAFPQACSPCTRVSGEPEGQALPLQHGMFWIFLRQLLPPSLYLFYFPFFSFLGWVIRGIDIMIYYSTGKNREALSFLSVLPFPHFSLLLQAKVLWSSECVFFFFFLRVCLCVCARSPLSSLSWTFTVFTDVAL